MAQDTEFYSFIERILGSEGGYVNHPNDPGGETNWGIAKRSFPQYDIRNLTRAEAIGIYYQYFWLPLGGSSLPSGVMFQMLDAAVNHGIGNAFRMLQRAVGVADDGRIGPITVAAVNSMDVSDVVLRFNAERIEFYTKLSTFSSFGRGWANRVAANLRFGARDN